MTGRAAFPHCLMFEDESASLFLMTSRTVFALQMKGEVPWFLVDVVAVRVMAVDAAHLSFRDEMVIRHPELAVGLQVALKAGLWIALGIDDELFETLPAARDVFAARSVAGLTARFARHLHGGGMETAMGAGGELFEVVGVTICAGGVADKLRAFDRRWNGGGGCQCRAGDPQRQRCHWQQDRQPSSFPRLGCHAGIVGSCSALANLGQKRTINEPNGTNEDPYPDQLLSAAHC